MPYVLYNVYGSPPCGLVRMLAKHLGIELELKNVDLFKKENLTPEYLKINPFHKVPSFSDDGFIIYESSAICYYLLRKHAPDSELYPNCPKTRARIDQALATVTSTIQPVYFDFMVQASFLPIEEANHRGAGAFFEEKVVTGFEHVIGDGKFVLGDKLSLADLSVVAHLTLALEAPFLDAGKYPKLKSYYERVKAQLPYFNEINEPGIEALAKLAAELKADLHSKDAPVSLSAVLKMPYVLYNLYGSPPCGVVRMLAKHLGIELELKTVDTFKKEHLTPDSAICYYLLRKHAPESELYPNCNKTRARIDQALATVTSTIQPNYFAFMMKRFYDLKKPTPEDLDFLDEKVIKGFEHVIGDGKFVLGDKLSLADLSVAAHLTLILEAPYLDAGKYPKLKSYYERVKAELPYFDEINEPGIKALGKRVAEMK
ncbi:hypothetical protein HPB48_020071 [Haemaphysalis longicornis]|uniref:Glutathione S-transferase n=1 Tax=Haemaphysalis longicornis TaxID=44386 RepID=A0A9J6GQR2_HAELO|nr:hypothetical protein HPB48_020071 [Haemaphysalis longicornis]